MFTHTYVCVTELSVMEYSILQYIIIYFSRNDIIKKILENDIFLYLILKSRKKKKKSKKTRNMKISHGTELKPK